MHFKISNEKEIIRDLKKSRTTCILHWNFRSEEVFPEEIRLYGTHLEDIYLKGNFIQNVPKWIVELSIINELHLSENKLEKLPEEITTLESLTVLSIDGNYLSSLPQNFFNLRNLVTFNASGNKFKFLPENVGRMKSLVHLDFSENFLTDLPESIGYLINLEDLIVDNNKLLTLTKSILYLPRLAYLRMHKNPFLYLPMIPFLSSPRIYKDCNVLSWESESNNVSSKPCNSEIKIFMEKIPEGTLLKVHKNQIRKSLALPFHHIIVIPDFIYPPSLFELTLRVLYEMYCRNRTKYEIDNEFYNMLPRNLQNMIRLGPNAYCSTCNKPIFDYALVQFFVFCQGRQTIRSYCNTDCANYFME